MNLIQYQEYLEYDNRRNQERRSCLSIATLRQIVDEVNLIHANVGSASGKMVRILGQAESWQEDFADLLARSGVCIPDAPTSSAGSKYLVTLEEINCAVEDAASNVSLDLEEARALEDLGERIQKWQERVVVAAPTRSKRAGKGKHRQIRCSVDDLISLISEASSLPIQTDEDVERLKLQLNKVHEWRLQAQHELREIAAGFCNLRQAIDSAYGLPQEFYDESTRENEHSSGGANEGLSQQLNDDVMQVENEEDPADPVGSAEDSSQTDTASIAESELFAAATSRMGGGGSMVYKMISSLLKGSKLIGTYTSEEEVADALEKVSKWSLKSLTYIDSPRSVYEKKCFGPFDKFLEAGEELLDLRKSLETRMKLDDANLMPLLSSSWGCLVSDQIVRLRALQSHRDQFIVWCRDTQQVLSSKEKGTTLEELKELAEQSYDYPGSKFGVEAGISRCRESHRSHVLLLSSMQVPIWFRKSGMWLSRLRHGKKRRAIYWIRM